MTNLDAFERTLIPHRHAAYSLARWLTRNEQDAEDIVQEAFLRAFRFFDSFNGGDGRAWLLAVVRNTYLSWTRRERRRVLAIDRAENEIVRVEPSAEKRLLDDLNVSMVRDCLQTLQRDYRDILVMREFEDMSYKQIAETAAIPLGTVMSRLSRARLRLGESLQACHKQ